MSRRRNRVQEQREAEAGRSNDVEIEGLTLEEEAIDMPTNAWVTTEDLETNIRTVQAVRDRPMLARTDHNLTFDGEMLMEVSPDIHTTVLIEFIDQRPMHIPNAQEIMPVDDAGFITIRRRMINGGPVMVSVRNVHAIRWTHE